jgi:hypothetical protein
MDLHGAEPATARRTSTGHSSRRATCMKMSKEMSKLRGDENEMSKEMGSRGLFFFKSLVKALGKGRREKGRGEKGISRGKRKS